MNPYAEMSREELLEALKAFAKNWLAHDGCWFLAAEERLGIDEAMALDAVTWGRFAKAEARRIMELAKLPERGGLEALERALSLRMYALVNAQHCEWSSDRKKLRFAMDACRVQEARYRKGLAPFPCRPVGEEEFRSFATTIDPRIQTRCIHCSPEPNEKRACTWEFTLADG